MNVDTNVNIVRAFSVSKLLLVQLLHTHSAVQSIRKHESRGIQVYSKALLSILIISLINSLRPSDAYMHKLTSPSLAQIMACRLLGTNAEILLIIPLGTNFSEILIVIHIVSFKKTHFKLPTAKWQPFRLASICYPWSTATSIAGSPRPFWIKTSGPQRSYRIMVRGPSSSVVSVRDLHFKDQVRPLIWSLH